MNKLTASHIPKAYPGKPITPPSLRHSAVQRVVPALCAKVIGTPWFQAGKINGLASEFHIAGCGRAGALWPLRRRLIVSARYGQGETPRLRQVSITLIVNSKAREPCAVRVP